MLRGFVILVSTLLVYTTAVAAELRLFGVGSWFFADQMNDHLRSEELKEIKFAPGWGVDYTFNLAGRFHLGARGMFRRMHLGDGSGAQTIAGDTYYSRLSMESGGPVLRLYLIDGESFRFDVFGGGTYLHADLETSTVAGKRNWQTTNNDYRFGSLAGASMSIGGSSFYLVIEGGYEWFYLTELRRSPNASAGQIDNLDLKGAFATIGFGFRPNFTSNSSSSSSRSPASDSGSRGGGKSFLQRLVDSMFDGK